MNSHLPDPRLNLVYRLEATVGEPQDVGQISAGQRRIVPLTGGTFSGPELRGTLIPVASADWQIILPDGTTLGDVRYTLKTEQGDLLYVQSHGVRHGPPEVLERLGRGGDVDPSEYTFRTFSHNRDRGRQPRLVEQGHIRQRGRPTARRCDLRGLSRQMRGHQRNDRNDSRISSQNSWGCSHAAK